MTKERPILFSGPLVRAILEGRKTQTRRVVKLPPGDWYLASSSVYDNGVIFADSDNHEEVCAKTVAHLPYGIPGDRLWVKEKHWVCELQDGGIGNPFLVYDDEIRNGLPEPAEYRPWRHDLTPKVRFGPRSPLYMPRWASRLDLEVTGVRVERLQDITSSDAHDEGLEDSFTFPKLWDSINARRGYSWESNPWVWVIEFKRVAP